MADKILKHDEKGEFNELIKNAVDPAFDPKKANTNESKFLSWTLIHGEPNTWQAVGRDGTIWVVEQDLSQYPKNLGIVKIWKPQGKEKEIAKEKEKEN
jgi:hypothetical protein